MCMGEFHKTLSWKQVKTLDKLHLLAQFRFELLYEKRLKNVKSRACPCSADNAEHRPVILVQTSFTLIHVHIQSSTHSHLVLSSHTPTPVYIDCQQQIIPYVNKHFGKWRTVLGWSFPTHQRIGPPFTRRTAAFTWVRLMSNLSSEQVRLIRTGNFCANVTSYWRHYFRAIRLSMRKSSVRDVIFLSSPSTAEDMHMPVLRQAVWQCVEGRRTAGNFSCVSEGRNRQRFFRHTIWRFQMKKWTKPSSDIFYFHSHNFCYAPHVFKPNTFSESRCTVH